MDDWQKEVLLSPYIDCWGEKPKKIAQVRPENAKSTADIMSEIKSYKNKIVIMRPDSPMSGKYAEKKAVLTVLAQRPDAPKAEKKSATKKKGPPTVDEIPVVNSISEENIFKFVNAMNSVHNKTEKVLYDLVYFYLKTYGDMSPAAAKNTIAYLITKGYLHYDGMYLNPTANIYSYSRRSYFVPEELIQTKSPKKESKPKSSKKNPIPADNIDRFVRGMNMLVRDHPREVWTYDEILMELSLDYKVMPPADVRATLNYLLDNGYFIQRGDYIRATEYICDMERTRFFVPDAIIKSVQKQMTDSEREAVWKSMPIDNSPIVAEEIDPDDDLEIDPEYGNKNFPRRKGQQSILSYERKGLLARFRNFVPLMRRR